MSAGQSPPRFMNVGNIIMSAMLRLGINAGGNSLLTVPGRKSGLPRTVPVQVLEDNGERLVQSPYGSVDWVRNLRTAGVGTLRNGRRVEPIAATELDAGESAAIFRRILPTFPGMIRKYYDITEGAPIEAWERMAQDHPMFRISPASTPG